MPSPRFIEVPADALLAELRAIGSAIEGRGGKAEQGRQGYEVVFDFTPHRGRGMVRVYTTLSVGADVARECGEDAVRVVVGHRKEDRFRPLKKHRKMLRTAPSKLSEPERVKHFLARLRKKIRLAFGDAMTIPGCPKCGAAMKLRGGKHGDFWGCTSYPKCRGTRPAKDRPETEGARA